MDKSIQEILESEQIDKDYTQEDLKEIADKLAYFKKDKKATRVYAQLIAFQFDPYMFRAWCEAANEDYNYLGLFYTIPENLPLAVCDMSKMDPIEETVIRWRLDHNK